MILFLSDVLMLQHNEWLSYYNNDRMNFILVDMVNNLDNKMDIIICNIVCMLKYCIIQIFKENNF